MGNNRAARSGGLNMRMPVYATVLLCLLVAHGCGPVTANYPPPKKIKMKELPEETSLPGVDYKFVWREEGRIHGFMSRWESAYRMAEKMERYAQMGNQEAAKDAKRFTTVARSNMGCVKIWVFAAYDVEQDLKEGELQLTFDDGTTIEDKGLFLYGPIGSGNNFQTSRGDVAHLKGKDDPEMQGRALYLFAPAEYLDREVVSIALIK